MRLREAVEVIWGPGTSSASAARHARISRDRADLCVPRLTEDLNRAGGPGAEPAVAGRGHMKTSVIEVGGLLSVLSARGVEKQLARLPGVERVEVNYAAGSATVVYDEER